MLNLGKLLPKKKNKDILPREREKHDWELVSKSYAPPRRDVSQLKGISPEVQEKALFGITVYLWQCKLTDDLRREEILGSDEPQLEELFMKVNKFGPQHIKSPQGEVFTLQKMVQNQPDPLSLPLRNPNQNLPPQ